jgi:hypothetical protein
MKKQLKNQKNRQIRRKIIKSSMTFNENKPNLSEDKFGAKHFSKRIYEILTAWRGKNQTQFKPNSNPIPERPKMNLTNAVTMNYKKFPRIPCKKQTQNKAKTNPMGFETLVLDFSVIQGKLLVSEKISRWIFREKVYDSTDGFNRLLCALLPGLSRLYANSGKFRQGP